MGYEVSIASVWEKTLLFYSRYAVLVCEKFVVISHEMKYSKSVIHVESELQVKRKNVC